MSDRVNFRQTSFVLSAAQLAQLPKDEGKEVAFIGRSNAGKSSTINTLTGIKGLARTSKTPGRTQQINVFSITEQQRLMDLPGYGYAKVPLATKANWEQTVNTYLQQRQSLAGLVVIMDIRHPMKALDEKLIEWATHCDLAIHVVLTKADKLSRGACGNQYQDIKKKLLSYNPDYSVQTFSSLDHTGGDELADKLSDWLQ